MKTLYTASVTSHGGRDGKSVSDDNRLSLALSRPGSASGTNPEQLFAAGYGACFASALTAIAKKQNVEVAELAVTAEVTLNEGDQGYFLGATLEVSLPRLEQKKAEELAQAAHQMCPYSKATRGNIDVQLKVNQRPLAQAA